MVLVTATPWCSTRIRKGVAPEDVGIRVIETSHALYRYPTPLSFAGVEL